ncbi:hypothetical protein GIB67_005225 [Kingdonia uniflora]|uniref:protein disulfide-isomerase n=1 Tax=Kingdonia uniflora TaxID=39325 RepID=A0A7J7NND7_9MAGN|nr:hypothetical protein GIB67_005225 [Kingdonia uniflora]
MATKSAITTLCFSLISLLLLANFAVSSATDLPDDISSPPVPPPESGSDSPSPVPAASIAPSPAPARHDLSSPPAPSPASDSDVPSPSPASLPAADIEQQDSSKSEVSKKSEGMSGGKKAGIVVGVLAVAGLVAVGVIVYKKRQDNLRRSQYGDIGVSYRSGLVVNHRHFHGHESLKDIGQVTRIDKFYGISMDHEENSPPPFDEKDVVVLNEGNFTDYEEKNRYVMVEFYAPWCGHCQVLVPEYAAAATELKGEAVLVKLSNFVITIIRDAIVTWIKKKTGPGVYNITSEEGAKTILETGKTLVLGFLDSLVGPENGELSAISKLDDDITFYQTASSNIAKLFQIDPKSKRPALVLLKKEELIYWRTPLQTLALPSTSDQFTKSAISDFVAANKLPLVNKYTRETANFIFSSLIGKMIMLFAKSEYLLNLLPTFQDAAKGFKGKLIFVYVILDDSFGEQISDYFGITGNSPQIFGFIATDEGEKYFHEGEVTLKSIKAFAEDLLENKLKRFLKSDPIPVTNDGDVKIVVGHNFDEIVLDDSKDVLLEVYAPWCGHCKVLEPIYNRLAKHLQGIDSLVVAKMDGTTNEHQRAKVNRCSSDDFELEQADLPIMKFYLPVGCRPDAGSLSHKEITIVQHQ